MLRSVLPLAVSLSLVGAAASTPLEAQALRSGTAGFTVGAALNGSSLKVNEADFGDSETESGGGLTAYLGYNFTKNLGVMLHATGANIDTEDGSYTLAQVDLVGRYTFANPASAFVPYIEAGFTGLSASTEVERTDVEMSGGGVTGAVGLNYYFNPRLALDVNFRFTGGEFNTLKVGTQSVSDEDGIGMQTGRFNIGVSYFPRRSR